MVIANWPSSGQKMTQILHRRRSKSCHNLANAMKPPITTATMAPIIHVLLSLSALLYPLQSCLADTVVNTLASPTLSHPNASNNDGDGHLPRPRRGYTRHDPSSGALDHWNDFLTNGRSPRKDRVPVFVDYMGHRKCCCCCCMAAIVGVDRYNIMVYAYAYA